MRKNFELDFKKVKYPEEDILNEEDILSEDILSLTDWAVFVSIWENISNEDYIFKWRRYFEWRYFESDWMKKIF